MKLQVFEVLAMVLIVHAIEAYLLNPQVVHSLEVYISNLLRASILRAISCITSIHVHWQFTKCSKHICIT
jgi:hypothetical protein